MLDPLCSGQFPWLYYFTNSLFVPNLLFNLSTKFQALGITFLMAVRVFFWGGGVGAFS